MLCYIVQDTQPVQALPILIAHQGRLIAHPHHPAIPRDDAVLHPERFASLVSPSFLRQHPLSVIGMHCAKPVFLVDYLRLWRVSEYGLVLWADVGDGLWIARLEGLLYVGDGRDLLHEGPIASLSLRGVGFKFLVGFLEILARVLGSGAAAHEHRGDPEEQETHAGAARKHEERQVALCSSLEFGQRGEVQAPLSPGRLHPVILGEQGIAPHFPGSLYAVVVIKEWTRPYVCAVVDLEIYHGVEGSLEDPIE